MPNKKSGENRKMFQGIEDDASADLSGSAMEALTELIVKMLTESLADIRDPKARSTRLQLIQALKDRNFVNPTVLQDALIEILPDLLDSSEFAKMTQLPYFVEEENEEDFETDGEWIKWNTEDDDGYDGEQEAYGEYFSMESTIEQLMDIPVDWPFEQYESAVGELLERDPHSVESLVALGCCAPVAEVRNAYFRKAEEAALHHSEDQIQLSMPPVRLSMARCCANAGHLADAVEFLRPALEEDPEDCHDVRWHLTVLMLQLGWDEMAQGVCDEADPDDPVIAYLNALLVFRREGDTEHARSLLFEAYQNDEDIAAYLTRMRKMPVMDEDEYVNFSAFAAKFLLPAFLDTSGAISWIRQTLADELASYTEGSSEDEYDREDFNDLPDEAEGWYLVTRPLQTGGNQTWFAGIFEDGKIIQMEQYPNGFSGKDLEKLIIRTAVEPRCGEPRRPNYLVISSHEMRAKLKEFLDDTNLYCRVKSTPKSLIQSFDTVIRSFDQNSRIAEQFAQPPEVAWDKIHALPKREVRWLFGCFQLPVTFEKQGKIKHPWLFLLFDAEPMRILKAIPLVARPSWGQLDGLLAETMLDRNQRYCPTRILMDPGMQTAGFHGSSHFKLEADEEVVRFFDESVLDFLLRFQSSLEPLIRIERVDEAFLRSFYETAAKFYRAKPWKMVGPDHIFELHCDAWENKTWAANVIGQAGQELGLVISCSTEDLLSFIQSGGRDLSKFNVAAIQFGESSVMVPADLWFIQRRGWPVVDQDAFPFVVRTIGGKDLVRVSYEDLLALKATMQLTPLFLAQPADEPFVFQQGSSTITAKWINMPAR